MLHQLCVTICNGMTKFYSKEYIGRTMLEAIKFCVSGLVISNMIWLFYAYCNGRTL